MHDMRIGADPLGLCTRQLNAQQETVKLWDVQEVQWHWKTFYIVLVSFFIFSISLVFTSSWQLFICEPYCICSSQDRRTTPCPLSILNTAPRILPCHCFSYHCFHCLIANVVQLWQCHGQQDALWVPRSSLLDFALQHLIHLSAVSNPSNPRRLHSFTAFRGKASSCNCGCDLNVRDPVKLAIQTLCEH